MKKQVGAIDFSGIEKTIVTVKGQNVLIDSDVASIYGVLTKEVNQAVKNNLEKFPSGYIIEADRTELVKNFDRFRNLKHSTAQPKAFTEKGLYMLATILKLLQKYANCRIQSQSWRTPKKSRSNNTLCKEAEIFSLN